MAGRGRGRGRGRGSSPVSSRDNGYARRISSEWDEDRWKPRSSTSRIGDDFSAGPVSPSESKGPESSRSNVMSQRGSESNSGATGGQGNATATGSGSGHTTAASTGWRGSGTGLEDTGNTETTTAGGGWGTASTDDWGAASPGRWGAANTGGWGTTSTGGWGESSSTSVSKDMPPPARPKALQVDTDDRMLVDGPAPPQSASSYRAASLAPSEPTVCATPQSAFPPFAIPSSTSIQNMTRSEIHSGIIKNSVRATRIRLELHELKRQLANWRLTQLSPQFHRVSFAAGQRLNTIGHDLVSRIHGVEARLKQAEEELLRFPDLPSSAPRLSDVDKEMMGYTEELKAWLQSFMALAVPETKPPITSSPDDAFAMDLDPTSQPRGLFAQVEESIDMLEERLDEMYEQIQEPDVNISSQKITERVDAMILAAGRKVNADQSTVRGEATETDAQLVAADELHRKLQFQAEQVALLVEKNIQGRKQIAALEAQREQRRRLKQAIQSQLEQSETFRQERRKQWAVMTEQITHLARPQPELAPVLDDAVLLRVRAAVEAMVQMEIVPALGTLKVQFAEAIERRMNSLQQSLQPAVDQTNDMCKRAEFIQV
ncbi:hypothetical protein B0H15DRAFT_811472 [Mycena belliarum]|uniref:Uncharacterized protein n=1 Tax=Mycena belliarum TaxID=1033014 RepID=A0AAD6XZ87_9AGAR|nr:hypothetical protein B0H15DRAFT_811472 [Mycena belliae]